MCLNQHMNSEKISYTQHTYIYMYRSRDRNQRRAVYSWLGTDDGTKVSILGMHSCDIVSMFS